MSHPALHEALPADPFESSSTLPGHVRLRGRKIIGVRTVALLVLGAGFLAAAWWVSLR